MSITSILISFLLILDIILFVFVFIKGKSSIESSKIRGVIFLVIVFTFLGIFLFSVYNEHKLDQEISKLKCINDSLAINKKSEPDSLLSKPGGKEKLIDSLLYRNARLENIIREVKKREGISRISIPEVEKTQENINRTEQEIQKAHTYNEVIDSPFIKKALSKGYSFSGETSFFIYYPPKNVTGNYLDFSLRFINESTVKNVAVIYIEIVRVASDGNYVQRFSSFYKPQLGMNNFIIPNLLKEKGTQMMVGFFWAKELGNVETPRFEKITFKLLP